MELQKIKENKAFQEWWDTNGYKYRPDPEDGTTIEDMLIQVRYWAWKAWCARSEKPLTT